MKNYKFNICVAGEKEGSYSSMSVINGNLSDKFRLVQEEPFERYVFEKLNLNVYISKQKVQSGEILEVTAENCSGSDICLTHVSVLNLFEFETEDFSKIKINYFKCNWENEFQYHVTDFFSEDIKKVAVHPITKSFKICSKGSYTTSEFYPMMVLEDLTRKKAMLVLQYPESSWQMETGMCEGKPYIDCSDINLRSNHTEYVLKPREKERFTKILRIDGENFQDCIEKLTACKRGMCSKKPHPLVFNDYMNCLWGQLDEKTMYTLVRKAAEIGLEYYCIDAGWYAEKSGASWQQTLGDWNPSGTIFSENGFEGFLNFVKKNGLKPGIWLEMEVCSGDSALFKKPDSWFLLYRGKRIGGEDRYFLNFKNTEVTDYLYQKVADFYKLGVRYIKNDYNCSIPYYPEEYFDHTKAVKDFYRRLKNDFPDLILENCASGAMRCDAEFLEIFDLQSTSDQEIYTNYPSIVQGALCNILPEQAGIWVYPNPHLFMEYFTGVPFDPSKYDIENVVFNIVNGFCGLPYVSGRIDMLSDDCFRCLRTGIDLYKRYRDFLYEAVPEYPNSISRMGEGKNTSLLLRRGNEALLIVWRFDGEDEILDLGKKYSDVEFIYPDFRLEDTILQEETTKICLKKKNTARILRCYTGIA